ncbi:High-affinity methionine permease [Wickerhamomyces ciferrii]|uniref:High-affinity methionine permease n=1 Tax=Wickerhamomyces ciferrii (strain ATCC 14091 / BCRC 22168 / CBS 111 / JCM 3599 / NBRC 0793 / NRRL Y-1031 F-60-10) TaxID=1206466 RepID=K0KCR1_WICCF|nr:High-affinity methionine permease [Wickerhamomyces ciferrii]CCH42870.1 High-affinity methionine permease [Wickerhamomyces ciferrii]
MGKLDTIDIVEPEFNSSENEEPYIKPQDKGYKDIGYISAIGLVCNRMIGTGIFATPATIYALCGNSVGLSLIMWVVGAIIAASGLYVYMEFGSAIPRNGGEKNYLEYVYSKPRFLVTSMYAAYAFLLGWAAGNSIIFGQYILTAAGKESTRWSERGIGVAAITFAFIVHSLHIKTGAYIQNVLGLFKIGVILFITVTGWVALGGWKKTDNFHNSFEGTSSASAYGVVNALYNVIWSFVGYSNVNYALGEVRNPVKTLKFASPIALVLVAVIYLFCNIAYFAIVPKEVLQNSSTILAADFFEIAFGPKAKKASSVFVALSALGNVMSVIFSQGRIITALGREGVLPFPKFFATSRPFNSPAIGLLQHWIVCVITILAPPPGDAYNFILNLISYPLNVVNFLVGLGLLWINYKKYKGEIQWNPPLKASIPVTIFFTLSSLYLIVAPYVPPTGDQSVYKDLPYYVHCVTTWGIFFIGLVYWVIWSKILPNIFHYKLHIEEIKGEDGFWRKEIKKISNDEYDSYLKEQGEHELNEIDSDIKVKETNSL